MFDRVVARPLPEALEELAGDRFDVVVAGDVLEHVAEPGKVLVRVRPLLRPGGALFVSLPNVANVSLRLSLLFGRFDYAPRGILDATHLRFFTRTSGRRLLVAHGFAVVSEAATAMPVELALPFLAKQPLASPVRATALLLARLWPTLFGYQFVWEAVPA